MTLRLTTSDEDLARAATLLRDGGLVAVPTETVYGLAVRADDADAVARLFAAKGRPSDNPLIVHVADVDAVRRVARELTPLARDLLARFAPGPLTVVLPARDDLPRAVTGGLDTVAVRIPDHPVARTLLRLAGVPLAAPSANRSSRPSPTRAEHVLADLDGRIDAVVDAGPTRIGIESTVVDARGTVPVVLREGGVTREAIAAALGHPDAAEHDDARHEARNDDAIAAAARSPGTRHPHYAPTLPVHLAPPGGGPGLARSIAEDGGRVGLVAVRASGDLAPSDAPPDAPADSPSDRPLDGVGVIVLGMPRDPEGLAADLYGLLRDAESRGLDAVVIESVAEEGVGRAVMDRLRRAAEASSA